MIKSPFFNDKKPIFYDRLKIKIKTLFDFLLFIVLHFVTKNRRIKLSYSGSHAYCIRSHQRLIPLLPFRLVTACGCQTDGLPVRRHNAFSRSWPAAASPRLSSFLYRLFSSFRVTYPHLSTETQKLAFRFVLDSFGNNYFSEDKADCCKLFLHR